MPTIAEQNRQDTDLMYELLQEGKLDLMYLPAGVIAWLWDRPESQVNAARDLAVAAKDACPVSSGAVLRSDQNILILRCEDGHQFNVYPDGGYGCDGESLDVHGCMKMLDDGMEPVPDEECPMEDSSHTSGDQPGMGPYFTLDAIAADAGDQVIGVAEDEGESILDDEREERATDLICKMRSVGNPLAKALQGKAGKRDTMEDEGEGDNVAFLKAMAPDELQDVLREVIKSVQFMAAKFSTVSMRSVKVRDMLKSQAGKQKVINDWIEAGAPFPIISGFHNTKAGPYQHQGDQFVVWENEYTSDSDEDQARHDRARKQGGEVWQKHIADYMADIPVDEAQGQQGVAGPIGTDMYDYEDEIPEIEAFVNESLLEQGIDKSHQLEISVELEDEETGEYLSDVPVAVNFNVTPGETEGGYTTVEGDIEVEGVILAKDLTFRGKTYRAGTEFPEWLLSRLPYQVLSRRRGGENLRGVFHGWLADKLESEHGVKPSVKE